MDPITTVLAGCMAYGGYKLYKLFSSPIYYSYSQDASNLEGNPVYTFDVIRAEDGTLNVDQITSNVILANKHQLVDAIKFAITEYGLFRNINSFVFYYGEIALVKLVVSDNATTNFIVRLPRNRSHDNKSFTIVSNKQYNFECPSSYTIPEIYHASLNVDGTLNISNSMLYNYPNIIHVLSNTGHTFSNISEIIFTYYNIPIIKVNINDQEAISTSLVMDVS